MNFEVLEHPEEALSSFYTDWEPDDRKVSALIGQQENIETILTAIEKKHYLDFHQALGAPACCAGFLKEVQKKGWINPFWCRWENSQHREGAPIHPALSTLLQGLDIILPGHHFCSFQCPESLALIEHLLCKLEEKAPGLKKILLEVLSWSMTWSTLHGIDEVKTPVFKMITNGQAVPQKLRVNLAGTSDPEFAGRGLNFPFVNLGCVEY